MSNRVFEIVDKVEAAVKASIEKHIEFRKDQSGEQLSAKHFEFGRIAHHFTMLIHTAYGRKDSRAVVEAAINEDGTLDLEKLYLIPTARMLYGSVARTLDLFYVEPEARLIAFKESNFGFGKDGEAKSAAEWFGGRLWKDTHLGFVWDVESVGAEIEAFLRELAEEGRLHLHHTRDYVLAPVMEGMADRHRKELAAAS